MEFFDKNEIFRCAYLTRAKNFTQLMIYVSNNELENVSEYLSEKTYESLSEINAKNSIGWTALHIAVRNSAIFPSDEMVEFLLKKGADPNVKDNEGWRPLHYASLFYNANLEIVELLLRSGATPIDEQMQILKLKIDIESFVEANEKLKQRIEMLENED